MKTISIYFVIVAIFFAVLSCKKENKEETKKETENELNFYSAPANSADKVVFISADLGKSNQIMAYGIFGSNGLHTSVNSLVFGDRGREYFGNLILDSSKRPKLFYLTKRNGTKDNVVLSFTYPANGTIVYNLYYYDWHLEKDSLLQQQTINTNNFGSANAYNSIVMEANGSITPETSYWNTVSSELKNIRNNIESVFNEKVALKSAADTKFSTGYMRDFMSGYKGGGLNTYFALIISQLKAKEEQAKEIASWRDPVKLDEFKPIANSEFSTLANVGSPTSGSIPNPTGTPSNPTGNSTQTNLSLLTGGTSKRWKVTKYIDDNGVNQLGSLYSYNWIYTFNSNGTFSELDNGQYPNSGSFSFNSSNLFQWNSPSLYNPPMNYTITNGMFILTKSGYSNYRKEMTPL